MGKTMIAFFSRTDKLMSDEEEIKEGRINTWKK